MSRIPNAISVDANVLRCGHNVGFFDNSDIERWADRQIEASENPCSELLDLSMIGQTHPLDVMRLLQSFGNASQVSTIDTQIGFIGLLRARKMITTQKAIRGLYALVHERGTTQEQRSQIYYLDDGHDLAIQRLHGTMDDVERELDVFVLPYATRLADEFPHLIPAANEIR